MRGDWAAGRLSEVPRLEHTSFRELGQLAAEHGAVNLGIGAPGWQPPEWVKAAGAAAISDPSSEAQYAPVRGHPRLLAALASRCSRRLGWEVDGAQELIVTAGANQALWLAICALVNPGDEVVVFEPCFDTYRPGVRMAGGVVREVPLRPPAETTATSSAADWVLDPAELEAAFGPRTRMVIINNPMNVPGKVWSRAELAAVAALVRRHGCIALVDEVYEDITRAGEELVHFAALPGMREHTVTVGSAGKLFSVTGWRVGWALAPEGAVAAMVAAHTYQSFAVPTPMQLGVAAALAAAEGNGHYARLRETYDAKCAAMAAALAAAGLRPIRPQGAFYMLADIRHAADPAAYVDPAERRVGRDWQFCRWMTRRGRVSAIPCSSWAGPRSRPLYEHFARFAFCHPDEQLREAAARLLRLRQVAGAAGARPVL